MCGERGFCRLSCHFYPPFLSRGQGWTGRIGTLPRANPRLGRGQPCAFSVFAEFLPLPARDEWGEGRGRGSPSLTWRGASSPRPSPPEAEEREKRQLRKAKYIWTALSARWSLDVFSQAELPLSQPLSATLSFVPSPYIRDNIAN